MHKIRGLCCSIVAAHGCQGYSTWTTFRAAYTALRFLFTVMPTFWRLMSLPVTTFVFPFHVTLYHTWHLLFWRPCRTHPLSKNKHKPGAACIVRCWMSGTVFYIVVQVWHTTIQLLLRGRAGHTNILYDSLFFCNWSSCSSYPVSEVIERYEPRFTRNGISPEPKMWIICSLYRKKLMMTLVLFTCK